MSSPDGRWVLTFNGEIYNYRELRDRLQQEGASFASTSDTEVVLWALVHWGTDALAQFNGMFALALYDRQRRTVMLARDPMGIKPLYWLDHPNGIVFSSQYDAVVRHPWCERQRLRTDVVALYLRFGYVPSPYGIVERTGQLRPGSVMTWSAATGPSASDYWSWPEPPDRYLGPVEAQERIEATLGSAVRRQLAADVPVGTFLSGGIDSPLVTAVSRLQLDRPMASFTIGSDVASFDETEQAKRYGTHLDVTHTVRRIVESDALSLYDEVIDAFGEPFGDYSAFPTMLVSRLAREQVTVALSGDGGDELFFGYPRMWSLLRWRPLFALPTPARRALRKAMTPFPEHRPVEGTTLGSIGNMYENMHSEFGGPTLAKVAPGLGSPPDEFDVYDLEGMPSRHGVAQWTRRAEVSGHLEKMLIKVDRASMHESLEVRVPLLDHDLVGLSNDLDPFSCMGEGVGKVPLRRELARHIPESMISKPKMGFGVPMGDWLRGGLADRFVERVLEHPVVFGDAFDKSAVRGIFDVHEGGQDRTQQLWNLLSLQEWADRHLRPIEVHSHRTRKLDDTH